MPAVPETIPAPRFCRLVKLAATVAIDWLSNSTLLLASRKRTTSALLPAVAVVTSDMRAPNHRRRFVVERVGSAAGATEGLCSLDDGVGGHFSSALCC